MVPAPQATEWMKKGNLFGKKLKELPEISYRIEYYNIELQEDGNYSLDLKVVLGLQMDVEYNFQPGSSNIVAKELLESRVVITRRSDMFKIINAAYRQLASPITNCVVIKTFMDIEQNRYKCGEDIPFNSKRMIQEAEVHNADR